MEHSAPAGAQLRPPLAAAWWPCSRSRARWCGTQPRWSRWWATGRI